MRTIWIRRWPQDVPIRLSIYPERDRYFKHHLGLGGSAWVYLNQPSDMQRTVDALEKLDGVESVISREEAVSKFRLYGPRIGDLCVFGDRNTVFGEMETASSQLPETYRSHGSLYERDIPLFVYNAVGAPPESFFRHNMDLTRWLYQR